MLQTLPGQKKYDKEMSDEHPCKNYMVGMKQNMQVPYFHYGPLENMKKRKAKEVIKSFEGSYRRKLGTEAIKSIEVHQKKFTQMHHYWLKTSIGRKSSPSHNWYFSNKQKVQYSANVNVLRAYIFFCVIIRLFNLYKILVPIVCSNPYISSDQISGIFKGT